MHLVGFIIRIYRDARSPECQISYFPFEIFTLLVNYLFKNNGISLCIKARRIEL